MNHQTKSILKASINGFLEASEQEKERLVQLVKDRLEGLDNIGLGYSEDFLLAGKLFLRIFGNKK